VITLEQCRVIINKDLLIIINKDLLIIIKIY